MGRTDEQLPAEELGAVLRDVVGAIEPRGLRYAVIGGLASTINGRPRWSDDIDLLVTKTEALDVLDALRGVGFETEETDPGWIYKAFREPIQVDLIFKLKGDIYLDDDFLAHARRAEFGGCEATFAGPEDMIVIKAVVHDEHTPRHWNDALAMLATGDVDWEYLLQRARFGARRILSLLVYAQSNDLIVPDDVVARLYASVYPPA